MFYGFDIYYFILILPALLFGLWAQSQVNNNFAKYSKIGTMRGMTGAQAAEYILQQNGIYARLVMAQRQMTKMDKAKS